MGGQVLELETGKAWERGMERGLQRGLERINQLNQCLYEDGRTDDLIRSIEDKKYQEQLLKEYNL